MIMDRNDMENEHLKFLNEFRRALPVDEVPGPERLAQHLAARREHVGDNAFAEFAYLQQAAAETWGAERTAHFARVLRDARVAPKPRDRCQWDYAEEQVEGLPAEWRPKLHDQISISRRGRAVLGRTIWSVDYTKAVLSALRRWNDHCVATGGSLKPTAASLHRYAGQLVEPEGEEADPVTVRTASNYLQRIIAGLSVATGGQSRSEACAYVVADWRERAKKEAAATKSGNQLVGAGTLYAFGFRLMAAARARPMRGVIARRSSTRPSFSAGRRPSGVARGFSTTFAKPRR